MAELSPQAQAVLDAYETSYTESGLAAALRAAVNQVVPGDGSRRANEIRSEFLALIAELENPNER